MSYPDRSSREGSWASRGGDERRQGGKVSYDADGRVREEFKAAGWSIITHKPEHQRNRPPSPPPMHRDRPPPQWNHPDQRIREHENGPMGRDGFGDRPPRTSAPRGEGSRERAPHMDAFQHPDDRHRVPSLEVGRREHEDMGHDYGWRDPPPYRGPHPQARNNGPGPAFGHHGREPERGRGYSAERGQFGGREGDGGVGHGGHGDGRGGWHGGGDGRDRVPEWGYGNGGHDV
eukprot:2689947-Rhodomonas_salina.2